MQFKQYFFSLTTEERKALASQAETSVGHLTNFSYGYTTLAPAQCVAVEMYSDKKVTRREMRPADWQAIWPELVEGVN